MPGSPKVEYFHNLHYAPPGSRATAWRVEQIPTSGHFITTMGGVKLCRVGDGGIYLYDKKAKADVFISIDTLAQLAG